MILCVFRNILFLILFGINSATYAAITATSNSLTYQGRILKSDGTPLEYSNVGFMFQITDPSGSCTIYQEQISGYNMTGSAGMFDVPIGTGTISWPSGITTVLDAFNNSTTHSCGACSGYTCSPSSSSYSPLAADGRVLRVSFYDGNGWRTVSPATVIRSVPFAGFAQSALKLGTNSASDFILKNNINSGASCGSGNFLTWDSSTMTFGCAAGGSGSGGISSVTASSPLNVTNGTSSPNITIQPATSTQSGYLSSADWTTFNNKLGVASAFSGDVSGTASTTSVDKLKGIALNLASVTSGQFLKYNGTNWVNSNITQSDVSGLSTTLNGYVSQSQFPASCASNQTLTFISPSGSFSCSPILINGSQVSGNIAGNAAGFTGSLTGDVSGTQGATSVDKIKGVAVSATTPTSNQVLQFNGSTWTPATISATPSGSAGGDLTGTYPNPTLATVTTANTGTKITYDSKGRVLSSTTLSPSDIPSLDWSKITSGTPTTLTGYGITNAIQNAGGISKMSAGLDANKPASPAAGEIYLASDTQKIYQFNSGSWAVMASAAGSGGTVISVNATPPLSSTGGINPTLSLAGLSSLGLANQIVGMNSGATGYEYKTFSGTINQVNINNAANSIILSTPQDIHTSASPTFAGLNLSGMSSTGFVKNNASGALSGGNSISASSDISGVLPVANGGTNASSFANYSVITSNSSGNALTAVPGSVNGSILQYSVTGPVFSNASYPSTTTVNQLLYSSANNVVGGLTTASNSVLMTNGSGEPSFSAATADIFSQYALLSGRSGGQTLYGGTSASNGITIDSTSDATKGNIILNPSGGNIGLGTSTPKALLDLQTSSNPSLAVNLALYPTPGKIYPSGYNYQATFTSLPSDGSSAGSFKQISLNPAVNLTYPVYGDYTFVSVPPTASNVNDSGSIGAFAGVRDYSEGSTTTGFAIGGDFYGQYLGAGTRSTLVGVRGIGAILNNSTNQASILKNIYGGTFTGNNASSNGSVTDGLYGISAAAINKGTVGSQLGIQATATNNGTATNQWGLIATATNAGIISSGSYQAGAEINAITSKPMDYQRGLTGSAINESTTGTVTSQIGGRLSTENKSSGNVGNQWGSLSIAYNISSGAVTNSTGASGKTQNYGSGTIGEAIGTQGEVLNNAGGTITSAMAIHGQVLRPNGTITNGYGLYLGAIRATSSWSVYAADSLSPSYFAASVGIGTTTPSSLLHVNGAAIATAWNTSSDIRLKTNIAEIENPIDKLLKLRGVEFDWRNDINQPTKHEQNHDIGVIAQEVEKVFPEAVTTAKDGYKAVAYSKLVSPIIAAVKAIYVKILSVENLQVNQSRQIASIEEATEKIQNSQTATESEIQSLKMKNALKDKEIAELKDRLNKLEKTLSSKK